VPEFNELWALTAYLIREQHYDEAHYLINKWQSYYPKQSAPHYELAQLFLAQMKPLQAAESIKFALKYAPPNSSQYKRSQELHKVIIDTL
jgi:predicted Zn-dependent protease